MARDSWACSTRKGAIYHMGEKTLKKSPAPINARPKMYLNKSTTDLFELELKMMRLI